MDELARILHNTSANITQTNELMEYFAREMLSLIQSRFDAQMGPDGRAWSSDLVDTGEFRDSYEVLEQTDKLVVVGPSGERNETIAEINVERGNIVAGFSSEDIKATDDAVVEFFDKVFRES